MGGSHSTTKSHLSTDFRLLAATKVSSGNISFVPNADASGCYYRDHVASCFVHVDWETETKTVLDFDRLKQIQDDTSWSNFVAVESHAGETKFLAAIKEKKSGKLFIVMFGANYSKRKIEILAEHSVGIQLAQQYYTYVYKSSNGVIYSISYWVKTKFNQTNFCVCKVQISGTAELTTDIIFESKTVDGRWQKPFIEDSAVYFITSYNEKDRILKIKFDGTDNSIIPISCTCNVCNNRQGHSFNEGVISSPLFYDGRFFFAFQETSRSSIWSFQQKLTAHNFIMRCEQQFQRIEENSLLLPKLQILSSGTAFLFSQSVILKLDLSISEACPMGNILLGEGSFGRVMQSKLEGRGDVAVKIIDALPNVSESAVKKLITSAAAEARTLKAINHKNVIKGVGFRIEENRFLLYMELMKESVRNNILRSSGKRLSENKALTILEQALEGLVHLHTLKPKPIVHRNIKCANLLISESGIIKLGDFGLSDSVHVTFLGSTNPAHAPNRTVGTKYWQAPEVLNSTDYSTYDRKADVWSIGCCLVEMLTGNPPYAGNPPYLRIEPAKWTIKAKSRTLRYDPKELVPQAAVNSIFLLKKAFRKATKSSNAKDIRPHSWELLDDVKEFTKAFTSSVYSKYAVELQPQNSKPDISYVLLLDKKQLDQFVP